MLVSMEAQDGAHLPAPKAGVCFWARRHFPAEQALGGPGEGVGFVSIPLIFSTNVCGCSFPCKRGWPPEEGLHRGVLARAQLCHMWAWPCSHSSVTPCTLAPRTRTRLSLLASGKGT